MSFDNNVTVNVLSPAAPVTVQTFDVLTVHDDFVYGGGELIKVFDSNQAAAADVDLSAGAKAAAAAAFSQQPHVRRVFVGTVPTGGGGWIVDANFDAILAENSEWLAFSIATRIEADILSVAAWAEANERVFFPQTSDQAVLDGTGGNVAEDLKAAAYAFTVLLWHDIDLEHGGIAWLSKFLSVDPDQAATIAAYKTLAGITNDELVVDDTEQATALANNTNFYITFGGVGATGNGVAMDGNFIDELITKLWFKFRSEEALKQLLLDTSNAGSKIPFNNNGIAMGSTPVQGILSRGERIGHFDAESTSVSGELTATPRKILLNAKATLSEGTQFFDLNAEILRKAV